MYKKSLISLQETKLLFTTGKDNCNFSRRHRVSSQDFPHASISYFYRGLIVFISHLYLLCSEQHCSANLTQYLKLYPPTHPLHTRYCTAMAPRLPQLDSCACETSWETCPDCAGGRGLVTDLISSYPISQLKTQSPLLSPSLSSQNQTS